jgi:hypothetical protein
MSKPGSKSDNPRTWTCLKLPDGCPCRCHAIHKVRREQGYSSIVRWTEAEYALLKYGFRNNMLMGEITELFREKSKTDSQIHVRTTHALKSQADSIHLYAKDYWWSQKELAFIFHVGDKVITYWRLMGFLVGKPRGSWWSFGRKDVEKFCLKWGGLLFDPETVSDVKLQALGRQAVVNRQNGVAS